MINTMIKRTRTLLAVYSCSLLIWAGPFVHAQGDGGSSESQEECHSCNTMPSQLEDYIEVMKELVQILDQTPDVALPGIRVPSFTENYLKKVLQQTVLSQGISPMITVLESTAVAYSDIHLNTAMLFGSKSIKRDRDRLEDLDVLLMQKAMAMWTAGSYYKPVPKDKLDKFDAKLKKLKYISLAKTWWSYNFKKTYGALLKTLWNLQNFYKDLHLRRWYTEQFRDLGDNFYKSYVDANDQKSDMIQNELAKQLVARVDVLVKAYLKEWIDNGENWKQVSTLDINVPRLLAHIRSIEHDYRCSIGAKNQCEGLAKIHKDSWNLMKNRVQNDTSTAMNTFKAAISRLKGEFRSEATDEDKLAAEQRKQSLLHSQWWYNGGRQKWFDFVDDHISVDDAASTKAAAKDISQRWKTNFKNDQRATRLGATAPSVDRHRNTWGFGKVSTTPDMNEKWWSRTDRKYPWMFATDEAKVDFFTTIVDEYEWQLQTSNLDAISANTQWNQQKYLVAQMVGSMQSSFDQILWVQDSRRTQAIYTDPSQVTYIFPHLSQAVYKSIEMIGEKNKETPEWPSLVKWFGEMCELQCPGLWWKRCAYYQD